MNSSAHREQAKPRLGEWLVEQSLISRQDLFLALNAAFVANCRIGDALVGLGLLRRELVELEACRLERTCHPDQQGNPLRMAASGVIETGRPCGVIGVRLPRGPVVELG